MEVTELYVGGEIDIIDWQPSPKDKWCYKIKLRLFFNFDTGFKNIKIDATPHWNFKEKTVTFIFSIDKKYRKMLQPFEKSEDEIILEVRDTISIFPPKTFKEALHETAQEIEAYMQKIDILSNLDGSIKEKQPKNEISKRKL